MSKNAGFLAQPPFPWLAQAWDQLSASVDESRLPHAVLITGPGDVGENELAIAAVQYLLCAQPSGANSCRCCKSCALLQTGNHPDFHEVRPEDTGKAIKIDQIRSITQIAAATSQQGGRKVILITPAEKMNRNAANALLKVLEEPGANCYFFLVTSLPARILPTIRSRCLHFPLAVPDQRVAGAWLAQQNVDNPMHFLEQAGGRPLRVVKWLEAGLFEKRKALRSAVERLLNDDSGDIEFARYMSGFDPGWVLDELLDLLAISARQRVDGGAAGSRSGVFVACDEVAVHSLYQALLQRKLLLQRGANLNQDIFLADLAVEIVEAASSPAAFLSGTTGR